MGYFFTVPSFIAPSLGPEDFKVMQFRDDWQLKQLIDKTDIILCIGMTFARYKSIKESGKYLIIDVYDPYNLATLPEYESEPMDERLKIHRSIHEVFNEQFYYGDFFLCASERQRDFWLGMLAALGRINPYSYNQDPTLYKMIGVVPFGLTSSKPIHTANVLKGVLGNIKKNDFVIIWGGGIYNWFDPLTLIRAMAKIDKITDDVKLFFMGVKHPNPEVRELQMVNETVSLAKKLKVYDKNVFFNFGWVDYNERQNYLLEADAGIITHPDHVETRFSFRTRVMDYLWASLPVISTEGDYLSTVIDRKGLGIITRDRNVGDLVDAIIKLKEDRAFYQQCVKNIKNIAQDYTWEKVCRPIIDFCRDPVTSAYRKNDAGAPIDTRGSIDVVEKVNDTSGKGKCYLMRKFFYHLFRSGPRQTLRFVSNYLRGK